ncbi:MAG TPA: GntR family transcriptional regulator [Candidatus Lachnoclostridium stercoravium]|uniref:GntR family transcriptional regulator n=1 Tax=Candidatus Lachnoclostridium stercoravium TaxID=2838633 RepID=A0A9D2HF41_9FIRM|nr:GntR family transcriptional regulator [Candidatus Lachnoclostridium stercoravium]
MEKLVQERAVPLAEQVFQTLEEDILQGRLKPGEVITELRLSKALGVSRTPIREALQHLEQESLVEIRPNRGAVVLGITRDDLEVIYDMRIRLEGLAASLAAKTADEEQLNAMKEVLDLQEFYVEKNNPDEQEIFDSRFHEMVYEFSGKRILYEVLKNLHRRITRYRRLSVTDMDRARKAITEHREIYEAIRDGNGSLADTLTIRHVENAKRSALASFESYEKA